MSTDEAPVAIPTENLPVAEAVVEPVEGSIESQAEIVGQEGSGAENVQMDTQEAQPRPEAINLSGVNELNQKKVQEFGYKYSKSPFSIEWINDDSLNLVFDSPEIAATVLKTITPEESEGLSPEQERQTKPHPSADNTLKARLATTADVKTAGSVHQSEYYKKYGAPSREERRIRFGTGRSEPMKYSRGDVLKVNRRGRKNQATDLFPHLATDCQPDDLFPHLASGNNKSDDLFPHLVKDGGISKKSSGRRNRNKGRRGGNAMEIDSIEAPTVSTEPKVEQTPTVYSNMDY